MTGLRIVVGVLTVYHLGIGLVSVLSVEQTAAFSAWFYGLELSHEPRFVYALKALGMYALFTASVLALVLRDPVRFRPIVYCLAGLQTFRALSRLIFFDLLHAGFGVSVAHNLFNVGLLVAEVALLMVFVRRVPLAFEPGAG